MVHRTVMALALVSLSVIPALTVEAGEGFAADIAPLSADRPELPPRERSREPLPLVFFDPTSALPVSPAEVKAEVEKVFGALGVPVLWREGRESPVTEGSDLQVILLPSDRSAGRLSANTMGAVRKAEDAPRALWVFLPAVRAALGVSPRSGGLLAPTERAFLARALARVIAHETIHAVAPDHPHSRHGLMSSQMSRKELLRDQVQVDDASLSALLAGLETWADGPVAPRTAAPEILALRRP